MNEYVHNYIYRCGNHDYCNIRWGDVNLFVSFDHLTNFMI